MNKYEKNIFKNMIFSEKNLINYGFLKKNSVYFYKTKIFDDQFLFEIEISKDEIKSSLTEIETGDIYTLFLTETAQGNFVGRVREEYTKILSDICKNCFYKDVFRSMQAKEILSYIQNTYKGNLEFLWEKLSDTAIIRRSDTQKWYIIFFNQSKRKVGLNSDEVCDMINIRVNPNEINSIIDNKTYFKGYHMNKKHWITILLDNSVPTKEIIKKINYSYNNAIK